jgi:hypothetical protein
LEGISLEYTLLYKHSSIFNETNYAFCSIRMWKYLMALEFDICKSIPTDYIAPKTPPTYVVGKNPSEHNEKSMNGIFCSL